MARTRVTLAMLTALCAGCMPLRDTTRAAPSTMSCIRAALHGQLPAGLSDKVKHCRAAALVAARCSGAEARLAGVAKEVADLLGPGNAEVADLRADWQGLRCARTSRSDAEVHDCCSLSAP